MRRPSPRLRRTSVTLTFNIWGTDVDGGRTITSTTTATATCSAFPKPAERVIGDDDRITSVAHWEFHFTTDPGLKVDDLVTVVDGARTHIVKVEGTEDASQQGVSYVVTGMERV